MTQVGKHFGDLLIERGILSPQELEQVAEKSKVRNLPIEETLFRLGYISRDRLGFLYAELYGGECVTSPPRTIPEEVLGLVSSKTAHELKAVPYQLEEDMLDVLVAGPFEDRSFEDIVAELEHAAGKKIRVAFCSANLLEDMLLKHYGRDEAGEGSIASAIESIKSEIPDHELRTEFEELYDVGQTALIGARSHPFNRAVAGSIEEAKKKLGDARKFMDSDFEEEAVQMASQAVQLLQEAMQKADTIERDWEKLVQRAKSLRAKVNALEEEGAAEFAPAEFKELFEIRESLIECINERNGDRLRYLLDQGMIIAERVTMLSPNRNKGREEVMTSLVQVRQVIARARKAGAKDYAPDALKEAYTFLDQAEASARRARWDEVRSFLSSAEAKAVECEKIALEAAEEKRQLTVTLRETIRAASTALEEAMACAFAQEAVEDLMRAKDAIDEAKTCFENGRQAHGIALAGETANRLKDQIIPAIRKAEQEWKELFRRTDESSAKIRGLDISLMMKLKPAKVAALLHAERDMVASLCSRDREQLAAAVGACESLLEQVEESYVEVTDRLKNTEESVAKATDLLSSAASSGIDADVAPAFVRAGLLLENARKYIAEGNAQDAAESADAAVEHLEEQVIEPQRRVRELWSDLVLQSASLLEEAAAVVSLDAYHRCPNGVESFHERLEKLMIALASREPESLDSATEALHETMETVRTEVVAAQERLHQEITAELQEIEQRVKSAVEKCSGYYAPDALESVYSDIKRLWEKLSEGPAALDVASEITIRRDLSVASAKLWQVEFLRERFEKERERNLRQLRLKMNEAREEMDACANRAFVNPDSPLLQEAGTLLNQAENVLIEGDMEGSFELVRACRSAVAQLLSDAREAERRWSDMAEALQSNTAAHAEILGHLASQRIAPEEFQDLSELDAKTADIIACKDVNFLSDHMERLNSLAEHIRERVHKAREELRERTRQRIQEVREQLKLARLLHADDICRDVLNAADSFEQIASDYFQSEDYDRALEAAADALAKASDAVLLAKAGIERAGELAGDYMKIASGHIAQGNAAEAAEALQKGLSLIAQTRISST